MSRQAAAEVGGWIGRHSGTGFTLEAELGKITRAIAQIVDAIADGMYHPAMKDKMAELERRKQSIEADLAAVPDETPLRLHPATGAVYRRKVEQLTEALDADEATRLEAAVILRGLISAVRLTPDEEGNPTIERVGELAEIAAALGEQGVVEGPTKRPISKSRPTAIVSQLNRQRKRDAELSAARQTRPDLPASAVADGVVAPTRRFALSPDLTAEAEPDRVADLPREEDLLRKAFDQKRIFLKKEPTP